MTNFIPRNWSLPENDDWFRNIELKLGPGQVATPVESSVFEDGRFTKQVVGWEIQDPP